MSNRVAKRTPDVLTFVIPVRNDAARLERCLESIRASAGAHRVHVIVGDNGSTDDTPERARTAGAEVASLPGMHVGAVRNAAAKMAAPGLLAFVDSDQELGSGWIPAAVDVMRDARVGATGCACVAPPNPTWVQRIYDALRARPSGQQDVEWLGAGNLVVRSAAFETLGGFDASLTACEDVDLCNRLRKAGWRLVSDDRMVNIHHGDPATLGRLFKSEVWRGRDNLRVTLRGPLTVHALPSILFPIANLVAVVVAALTCIFWPGWGWPWLAASLAVLFGTVGLRSARIFAALTPRSLADLPRAIAVGATYEAARATALVRHAPHHRGAGR
jgi:GT2 family glycosyltransferase